MADKLEYRDYKCKECGHEKSIQTNHFGECYSFGNYNVCPICPPYKRPNTWVFNGDIPSDAWVPTPWKKDEIKIKKN